MTALQKELEETKKDVRKYKRRAKLRFLSLTLKPARLKEIQDLKGQLSKADPKKSKDDKGSTPEVNL